MYRYIKAEEYEGAELEYNYDDTMGRISGEVDENGTLYTEEEIIDAEEYTDRQDIIKVVAPNCKEVETAAFFECSNLSNVELPNCTEVGKLAFYKCKSLSNIELPKCEAVGECAFEYCKNLSSADLPDNVRIYVDAFTGTPLQDEF